jgi:ABC-type dipeptide/oligopeptide/nickel transport system ATPase component
VSELLNLREVKVELPTAAGWVRPVNEVSLRIGAGERVGLVGESASGKPMLSLALMAIGFAATNPKKLKGGTSVGIAFGMFAVYVGIRVGLAFAFS